MLGIKFLLLLVTVVFYGLDSLVELSVPTAQYTIRSRLYISCLFYVLHPDPPNVCTLQHLNFEKSYSLQFPLLSDIGANVADLYGSKLDIPFMGKFANRLTFIIGSDGKIEKVI